MPKKEFRDQYLIYSRRSTDDAENQKNSIDYQTGQSLKFAKNENLPIADYTLDGFCKNGIIEERHTAFKTSDITINKKGNIEYSIERPKFQTLVKGLISMEFKGMICLCWDRISRNDQDGIIIKKLMDKGVDFKFIQASYEKSSSGALHMDIDGMFAAHYSRVISEKVKNTFEKLRGEGRCLYLSPIGYLDEGSDNKPLDPERAPIVKRVFELYSTGEWSLSQLAKWAKKQGLTSKPKRRYRTKEEMLAGVEPDSLPKTSHPANKKTIENILRNPFYIGKLKTDKNDSTKFIDGNYHQPLISISLFNKVQEVLKSRNVSIQYVDYGFYIYRSLIRCTCGRCYSPYTKKGINYYRVRCVDGCDNPDKNLKEEEINESIEDLLVKIHFSEKELEEIQMRAIIDLDKINESRNKELDDLNSQRKRVYKDLNYLTQNKITLLRNNTMSAEEVSQEEVRLTNELEIVEVKTGAHVEAAGDMLKYVVTFSELVKKANLYYKKAIDTEKRDMAVQVFSELVFADRKLANYKAKEGFEALLNCHSGKSGAADYLFTELPHIYEMVKISMEKLERLPFIKNKLKLKTT